MKRFLVAAAVFSLGALPGFAQTGAPAPANPPAAPAAQGSGKDVRAQCRAEAQAKGLKGPLMRAAVQNCFAQARPDLAAANACRKQGKDKGLFGQELNDFVKGCKAGKL
ncbi:MAG TPA: PsiF repeat-containing protein [Methylocella sp.]|nr:PsiF repeat-containing protein [Methylocella sp.]